MSSPIKYVPRLPSSNPNVPRESVVLEFFRLLLGLSLVLIVIWFGLGLITNILIERLPASYETYLGRFFPALNSNQTDFKEEQIRLESLVNALSVWLPEGAIQIPVGIIESDEINAYTTPGPRIYVTTGLLKGVSSENELSMVLGHELGHVANRDALKGLGRLLPLGLLSFLVLGENDSATRLLFAGIDLGQLSFSRNQELAADQLGLELLQRHYGHVAGAAEFFEKLSKDELVIPMGSFLQTHPYSESRVEHIRTLTEQSAYEIKPDLVPFQFPNPQGVPQ